MAGKQKVVWNPFTPGYFEDPYPHLKACRKTNPIQKGAHGEWIFFEYKEVSEILRSKDFKSFDLPQYFVDKERYIFKGSSSCPHLAKSSALWPNYLNGDFHKKIRIGITKALNEIDIPSVIEESIEQTSKEFKNKDQFDLVNYCSTYIFKIVKQLLDISDYDSLQSIRKYSNMLARSQDVFVSKSVYQEINDWFEWGKKLFRRSRFRDSIISYFDELKLDYSEDDIYSVMTISLMAAFETSKDNLSVAFLKILEDDGLKDFLLNASASEQDVLIEELLRYSSPLQYTIRVNNSRLQFGENIIPKNSKVYLSIASANRDPKIFSKPDLLIPTRNPNNHIAFGAGVHVCLGASIARQEMKYCLKPMIQFLKEFKAGSKKEIVWSRQIFMRTLDSLTVRKQ